MFNLTILRGFVGASCEGVTSFDAGAFPRLVVPDWASAEAGGDGMDGILDSASITGTLGAIEVGASTPSQLDKPAWRGWSCSDCLLRSVFRLLRRLAFGSSSGLDVLEAGVVDDPKGYGNGIWTV